MEPATFPEANTVYGPPPDLAESQCRSIPAYHGEIQSGSCDGCKQVVVAYDLSPDEVEHLRENPRIFLSMIGGLAPHYLSFTFEQATHPL